MNHIQRALQALADDSDHITAPDDDWFIAQLACWPDRVDEANTTNVRFLLTSAAASLLRAREILEAAMCMWEWVVEHHSRPEITACLEGNGWAAIRMDIAALAPKLLADFEALDEYDGCFDWDFVPDWMQKHVDWSDTPQYRP